MLNHDVKFDIRDDSILQNSIQEPSTSSKYDCVLDTLLIMLGTWKLAYKSRMTKMLIYDVKFDTIDYPVLQSSSQEPSMISKYDCVIDELIIMLGGWKCEYNLRMKIYVDLLCQIWCQRWPNALKLQSRTTNILQVWLCS